MNRFHQLPFHRRIRAGFLIPLCTFGLVMILFLYGIGNISSTTDAEQQRTLADALRRCAVQNYALTGSYPDTLEDLLAHYAVAYDENKYTIHYEPFGSNIMPDITIVKK